MIRRLRSREGCDRCRLRRKKCDEQHPTCFSCSRWNLTCTWSKRGVRGVGKANNLTHTQARYAGGDDQPLIIRMPALSCHQDGMLANGYQTFSGDREFYLASTCPLILSYILNPYAAGQGRDTSRFTSLVLLDSSVRAAWVAFAAKILTFQDSYKGNAQESYYSAMVGTRKALQGHKDTAQVFSLIATMLFMALYEIYGNGDPNLTFMHATAALILAGDSLNGNRLILSQPEYLFLTRSIEWTLFAVANSAIYQPDISILHKINWSVLHDVLNNSTKHINVPSDALPLSNGKIEIYTIFCQAAALAREPHSQHLSIQILAMARRVDEIEPQSPTGYGSGVPAQFEQMFKMRWPFIVRSVRMYLSKVFHRTACSGNATIRALMRQSIPVLHQMEIDSENNSQWSIWPLPHSSRQFGVHRNQGMFWHCLILMAAVHEIEDLDIIEKSAQALAGNIPWRHHKKMARYCEIIRARKRDNLMYCTASSEHGCTVQHDGLDFLLHKHGIFGALGEVDETSPSP